MTATRQKLMNDGHTWDEAEDILWAQAEDENDAERDRQVEEYFTNQGEK